MTPSTIARTLVAVMVTAGLSAAAAEGQRPERPQQVQLPGLGIALRAGWQMFFHDGCRFAVPVSWRPTPDGAQVVAPNGSSLSVWMDRFASWPDHKTHVRAALAPLKNVYEDSARRLWIGTGDASLTQHFVAVANESGACSGSLEIRASTPNAQETAAVIVDSIGSAPATLPQDRD
jgi:hypothetical protein